MKTIMLTLLLSSQLAISSNQPLECITTDLNEYGFAATDENVTEYVCKNPMDHAEFVLVDETMFPDLKVNQSLKVYFNHGDIINVKLNDDKNMSIL
ncbi:hypothetical protein [Oceanobacillus sp. FSL H7-0719]|uniref:hypothetical protein n=1 Tax=Oceanobacillus sp. FSL H7-0719 TaxID=2954507 RepID=UPI0032440356